MLLLLRGDPFLRPVQQSKRIILPYVLHHGATGCGAPDRWGPSDIGLKAPESIASCRQPQEYLATQPHFHSFDGVFT